MQYFNFYDPKIAEKITKSAQSKMNENFLEYFNSFYGVEGVYSSGRNVGYDELNKAVIQLPYFEADSFDRERCRDIIFTDVEIDRMYGQEGKK